MIICSAEQRDLYRVVERALRSLVSFLENPSDTNKERKLEEDYHRIYEIDTLSGFWRGSKKLPNE